jgi:hypothetical protein
LTHRTPFGLTVLATVLFAAAVPAHVLAQELTEDPEVPSDPPESPEPAVAPADEREESEESAPEALPTTDEASNLWWVPGVLGLVTTAVSVAGYVNVRQSIDQRQDERTAAEACAAAGRVGPACEDLGPLATALLMAATTESVCEPETAERFGIEAICDERDRDRRRQVMYLTFGTLGFLVGVGSFIAYAVLEGRDDDPEERTAHLRPWLSLGGDRAAGLAFDLAF